MPVSNLPRLLWPSCDLVQTETLAGVILIVLQWESDILTNIIGTVIIQLLILDLKRAIW